MTEKKISAKRQEHLERQSKKLKNQYTKEDRQIEMNKCIAGLEELNLFRNYNDDMEKIHLLFEDYVKTGEPSQGTIPITGTKRIFYYTFPRYNNIQISTGLKYDKNV